VNEYYDFMCRNGLVTGVYIVYI